MNLSIRDFETNLFSRLHLKGITLTAEADSSELISIDELLIHYQLFSIFGKNPHITMLALDGLTVDMNWAKSDSVIQSRLEKFSSGEDSSNTSIQVTIDQLALLNTAIHIEDNRVPLSLKVEGVDINGRPVSTDTIAYEVHLKTGKGVYDKSELNLSQLHMAGTFLPKEMIGSAQLQVDRLQADSIDVNRLETSVRMNREAVVMDTFQTRISGGLLAGSGRIGLTESETGYLSLQIEGIQLMMLQNSLNQESALTDGYIQGAFYASGEGTRFLNWNAFGKLNLSGVSTQKQRFPPYHIDFRYTDEQLHVTLTHESSSIIAHMEMEQKGFSGTFSLFIPKMEAISSFFMASPVYATVFGEGRMSHLNNRLKIDLNIQANNLQFQEYRLDSLNTVLTYDQHHLWIHNFQAIRPSGWNPEQSDTLVRTPFSISLNGEFNTENLSGTARASIYPVEGVSSTRHSDSIWTEMICEIAGSKNQLESIRIRGEVKNLSFLQNIIHHAPALEGRFLFDVAYHQRDSLYQIVARSKIDDPSFQGRELADSLLVEFEAENRRIDSLQLTIYQNSKCHRMESSLEFDHDLFSGNFDQTIRTRGNMRLDSLDLGWIASWFPDSLTAVGFIDAEIDWEGTFPEIRPAGWMILNADIHQPAQQLKLEGLNLHIAFKDTLMEMPFCRFVLQSIPVSLKAQVIRIQDNSFKLHADADVYDQKAFYIDGHIEQDSIYLVNTIDQLPVSLFEPLYPDIQPISGLINARMTMSGKAGSPMIDGKLEIQNIVFTPHDWETPFSDGYLHLLFSENQFHLDTLYLAQNQGYISASGFVQLDHYKTSGMNFKTEISKCQITRQKLYDIRIQHARIEMETSEEQYLLRGLIVTDKSTIQYTLKPSDIVQQIQTRDRPRADQPELLKRIQFDIRIQESDQLWLDNNFAKVRLHPELSIGGNPENIRLAGRVSVEEGYILYLDRRFQINRGIIYFSDPNRINPEIDLIATNQMRASQTADRKDYTITLAIQGPLDQARLQLSSEPVLDKADIVALLTVGTTRRAATSSGDENLTMTDLLRERAAAISNERIISYASKTLNQTINFAEISIAGNVFGSNDQGPTLTASRNISRRMTITYSTRIGHINDQSIRLNYILYNRLMLQGETDQYGRSGLDLIYGIGIK